MFIFYLYNHICGHFETWLVLNQTSGVPLAREAAAADGPPEEPHFPSDPGAAGRPGPDWHAQDREDGSGVPAGEHTGAQFNTIQFHMKYSVGRKVES